MSTQFDYPKHFYFKLFSFCQTFLIQPIQFHISIDFVYMQLNIKTVLFQTIQFSISMQFSSFRLIDRTLSGATTLGQSGSGSDVLCIPQSLSITGASPSDCVVSYSGHLLESYPSAEKQLVYSTAPANWASSEKSYPSAEKQSVYSAATPSWLGKFSICITSFPNCFLLSDYIVNHFTKWKNYD